MSRLGIINKKSKDVEKKRGQILTQFVAAFKFHSSAVIEVLQIKD